MSLTKIISSLIYGFAFLCAGNIAQVQPSIITSQGNNVLDSSSARRTAVGLINVEYMRGNQIYRNGWYNIQFDRFQSPKDDGAPLRILSLDNSGWLKVSALNSLDSRYATNAVLTSGLAAKFDIPAGNTGQYLNGLGALVTFPSIPAAQIQADWNQSNNANVDYVKNKPTLGTAAAANTADFATAAQGALATSALQPNGNGSGLTGLTKSQVGLSNVDNTSDATKNSASATLTNKTISGSSNTITNIGNGSLTNSSITINGNSVSLGGSTTITASPAIGFPVSGLAITSGTAFQPRAGGPCNIVINSSLGSGLAAVTGTIVIAISTTQNGTYTTITTDGLILSLLNASLDRSSATISVPTGCWIKVTNTVVGVGATISSTYTRWDL